MSLLPDWLTGFDSANSTAASEADAQLQVLNNAQYGPGGSYYTPETWTAVNANRDSELANGGYGPAAQQAQIDQTFTDKLDSQAQSIIGGPLGVAWATIKAILKSVPWWVWILGFVAVFFWLGGAAMVRAWVGKKAKQ